jgi:hypothetical protein
VIECGDVHPSHQLMVLQKSRPLISKSLFGNFLIFKETFSHDFVLYKSFSRKQILFITFNRLLNLPTLSAKRKLRWGFTFYFGEHLVVTELVLLIKTL